MIVTGGTVFIRQADQLPQITLRGARVVMEVSEPAEMQDFIAFMNHRLDPGSLVTGCTFFTLESWAQVEATERIALVKADVRNEVVPGWGRRMWQRLTRKVST